MDYEVCSFASIQPYLIAWIREVGCTPYVPRNDFVTNLNKMGTKPNIGDETSGAQTEVCFRAEPQGGRQKN
jgi:hypothetical protein